LGSLSLTLSFILILSKNQIAIFCYRYLLLEYYMSLDKLTVM